MSDSHGNLIKTPKQLIIVVSLSFFVPLLVILLLMVYVNSGKRESGSGADAEKVTALLIKPIGQVTLSAAAVPAESAATTLAPSTTAAPSTAGDAPKAPAK